MATKPVKIVTDLITNKQLIKQDVSGNILFRVSGTLENGNISSSLPFTGSDLFISGKIYPGINALADVSASNATNGQYLKLVNGKWIPATIAAGDVIVNTSGNIIGNGQIGDEIRLKDDISIVNLTASAIQIAGPIINSPESSFPFSNTFVTGSEVKLIDEFSQTYSAAKYIVLCKTATNAQMAEIGVVFRGSTALAVPYAISYTTNFPMASFSVEKDAINNTLKLFIKNETLAILTVTMQRAYLI